MPHSASKNLDKGPLIHQDQMQEFYLCKVIYMPSETNFGVPHITDQVRLAVKEKLQLPPDAQPRVSFLGGPGDVFGTYEHWKQRRHDPRVPIITYSAQFFELMSALDARAQVIVARQSTEIEDSQFRFDSVTRSPFQNRREYFASERAYGDQVVEKINEFDPHIVIGATDFPSSHWSLLGKGRYFILSAHNTFWPRHRKPKDPKALVKQFLLRKHAKAIDDAVCTSLECSKQISEVTLGRVNGLAEYPQMIEAYPWLKKGRARELLFLGRIEQNKGVFLLLEVFANLLRKYPELKLTFAGDGSAQSELQDRISEIGSNNIKFVGRLNSVEVHDAIANSDLMLCPTMTSFNEGLAVVGFEAAAHGVPTLLSSCVPALDYLGDGCIVFEADNIVSLENALERLVADPVWYQSKVSHLSSIRPAIYDRDKSWGSKLLQTFLRIERDSFRHRYAAKRRFGFAQSNYRLSKRHNSANAASDNSRPPVKTDRLSSAEIWASTASSLAKA